MFMQRQRQEYRQGLVHVGERARGALADDGQRPHVIAISEVFGQFALAAFRGRARGIGRAAASAGQTAPALTG